MGQQATVCKPCALPQDFPQCCGCGGSGEPMSPKRRKSVAWFCPHCPTPTEVINKPLPCTQHCVDNFAENYFLPARVVMWDNTDKVQDTHGMDAGGNTQDHLLTFADELTAQQLEELHHDVSKININAVNEAVYEAFSYVDKGDKVRVDEVTVPKLLGWSKRLRPRTSAGAIITNVASLPAWRVSLLRNCGLEMLGDSKVALVLLVGSTDRRLGSGSPSGTVDIGLLSGKSLIQLFMERLVRLRHLVARFKEDRKARRAQELVDIKQRLVDLKTEAGKELKRIEKKQRRQAQGRAEDSDDEEKFSPRAIQQLRKVADGGTDFYWKVPEDMPTRIPLYLMCNDDNLAEHEEFFKQHSYFGLPKDDVHFFAQGCMPAVDPSGNILLQEKHRVALHPDGGGGVWDALVQNGFANDWKMCGVEHVYVAGQDNLLLKMADPLFLGVCGLLRTKMGLKVCERRDSREPFGTYCQRFVEEVNDTNKNGKIDADERQMIKVPAVLETMDVHSEVLRQVDSTGNVIHNQVSMCEFYCQTKFVEKVARKMTTYHALRRRQPFVHLQSGHAVSPPQDVRNSFRLEKFVGDSISLADRVVGVAVRRLSEFAYLKRTFGDYSPEEAVCWLSTLHFRWIQDVGGVFEKGAHVDKKKFKCEISPLVTYTGEGLEGLLQGPNRTKGTGEDIMRLPIHVQSALERQEIWTEPGLKRAETLGYVSDPWVNEGEAMTLVCKRPDVNGALAKNGAEDDGEEEDFNGSDKSSSIAGSHWETSSSSSEEEQQNEHGEIVFHAGDAKKKVQEERPDADEYGIPFLDEVGPDFSQIYRDDMLRTLRAKKELKRMPRLPEYSSFVSIAGSGAIRRANIFNTQMYSNLFDEESGYRATEKRRAPPKHIRVQRKEWKGQAIWNPHFVREQRAKAREERKHQKAMLLAKQKDEAKRSEEEARREAGLAVGPSGDDGSPRSPHSPTSPHSPHGPENPEGGRTSKKKQPAVYIECRAKAPTEVELETMPANRRRYQWTRMVPKGFYADVDTMTDQKTTLFRD